MMGETISRMHEGTKIVWRSLGEGTLGVLNLGVTGKGMSPVIKYINSSKRQILVQDPALICSGLELDQVTSPRLICLVCKMKLAMGPTLPEVLHSMPSSGQVLANFAHHLLI